MSNPYDTKPAEDDDNFEYSVDQKEVESPYFVPDGAHRVTCINVSKEVSKSSGNPMYVWDFNVNEGVYKGRSLRAHTVLTPAAAWRLDEVCQALKLPPSKVNGKTVFKFKGEDAIGRECIVEVLQDEKFGSKIESLQAV